jgi:hypothetical protein
MTVSSDNDNISCNNGFLAGTGAIETTLIIPEAAMFRTGASGVVEMYRISELRTLYNFVYSVLVLASLYPLFAVCVAVETDYTLNINIGCWSSSSEYE